MTEREALTLAILALNTCQEPDATSNEDWNKLERDAPEAITILMELRGKTAR